MSPTAYRTHLHARHNQCTPEIVHEEERWHLSLQ
jgi:hypothetical protein